MPSFFTISNSTTPQTLSAGQNGFVAAGFTLYSELSTTVTINGSANLTVMGTLATSNGTSAVRAPTQAATDISLTVGEAGSIISGSTDAVRLIAANGFQIANAGLISGDTGIYLNGTTTMDAFATINNTGTILGQTTDVGVAFAINFDDGVRSAKLSNSGTIQIGSESNGSAINFDGSDFLMIRNSGSIISQATAIVADHVDSHIRLANSGTISGDIRADGKLTLVNSGAITVDETTVFGVPVVAHSDGNMVLRNSGAIEGSVRSESSAEVRNTGEITGSIVYGATSTIVNSGTIGESLLALVSVDATQTLKITNIGQIGGRIEMGQGNDTFVNAGGFVVGRIEGNAGNDLFVIDRRDLIIDGGAGTDTVDSTASYRMGEGIEILRLMGTAGLAGTGRETGDQIYGTDLNDTLRGLAGVDSLQGNDGDDTLVGGLGDDKLDGGEGNDALLGSNGSDRMFFSGGVDTLVGGIGRDSVEFVGITRGVTVNLATSSLTILDLLGEVSDSASLSGIEDVTGTAQADTIIGSTLGNILRGGDGADRLEGGAGNDKLDGGIGADNLLGGAGKDELFGGTQADRFIFATKTDSAAGTGDVIMGFEVTLDIIDLGLLDSDPATAADLPFAYLGTAAFSGSGPQLRHVADAVAGTTTVQIRFAGSAATDMEIVLNSVVALTVGNFVL